MHPIEIRLAEKGYTLPAPAAAVATYTPYTIHNGMIFISGQLPFVGTEIIKGILGENLAVDDGVRAAKACALMILSQAKAACGGDFNHLDRCLRLGGFVASTGKFTDHPVVINGASDLIGFAMSDAGVHARAAVGVSSLPLGAAVEIDAIFTLK